MLKIADSHLHYWNPIHQSGYDWLKEFEILNQPVLTDAIPKSGDGWEVEQIMFVQAGGEAVEEARWVASLAEQDSRITGIVAFAPLEQGTDAHTVLDQLKTIALVRGIRRLIQSEAPGFCEQPAFIEGVKLCAEYHYTFDLCLRHFQLPEVIELVRQCPGVNFVLDHIGKPNIKDQVFDPWKAHMKTLSEFPNVMCKLSGMVTEADWESWTPEHLRPYIDHTIEVFGINRVMFGSDSPMFRLANTSYARWVEVMRDATSGLAADELQKLFYSNTLRFYGIQAAMSS